MPINENEVVDDCTLVAAIAAGDKAAFGRLYDRHSARLLGIGIAILKNRREAEDLLHDVFMELWQKSGSYDPARSSVDYWLVLRLRSRALDRLRAMKNKQQFEHQASCEPKPESTSGSELELFQVTEAMETLSEPHRQVLTLSYLQGYSCSEISKLTNVPTSTIKSRLQSAMKKMRLHFELAGGAST